MMILTRKLFLLFYVLIMQVLLSPDFAYSSQPNILLIGIDTLRAGHVGCLGYHRNTTDTLDKLAKKGVVFSRAMATSSWTAPTVMSVLTSLYPGIHNLTDFNAILSKNKPTLTEILKNNDYATAAFISNYIISSHNGFSRGFDLFDDFSVELDLGLDLFGNNDNPDQNFNNSLTNEAVNRAALSWLQKNYQKQFFMFIFYVDPHYDYIPPPPFDTVFDPNYKGSIDGRGIAFEPSKDTRPAQRDLDHIIALYDGEIINTDGYIAKLLGKFEEYGILDETLVIVFGDHGEEFYEHGSSAHGHSLYQELIHVPLIFSWPSVISQNKRVNALVSQVDIMPTILDYLNIKYDGFMQGSSLRPLIDGKKEKLHDIVYAEVDIEKGKAFAAAISRDSKFIFDLNTHNKQLFDLNNDPDEQINIYLEKSSDSPIHLEESLVLWMADNFKMAEKFSYNKEQLEVELDEQHLEKLKSLGYIQ